MTEIDYYDAESWRRKYLSSALQEEEEDEEEKSSEDDEDIREDNRSLRGKNVASAATEQHPAEKRMHRGRRERDDLQRKPDETAVDALKRIWATDKSAFGRYTHLLTEAADPIREKRGVALTEMARRCKTAWEPFWSIYAIDMTIVASVTLLGVLFVASLGKTIGAGIAMHTTMIDGTLPALEAYVFVGDFVVYLTSTILTLTAFLFTVIILNARRKHREQTEHTNIAAGLVAMLRTHLNLYYPAKRVTVTEATKINTGLCTRILDFRISHRIDTSRFSMESLVALFLRVETLELLDIQMQVFIDVGKNPRGGAWMASAYVAPRGDYDSSYVAPRRFYDSAGDV